MLKNLINSNGNLQKLLTTIEKHTPVSVFGVGKQEKILILNEFEEQKLIVCCNDDEAINVCEMLTNNGQSAQLFINNLETEVSNFSVSSQINLITGLQNIVSNNVEYVVTSPNAIRNKLPSFKMVENYILKLEVGKNYNLKMLTKQLVLRGYKKVDVVTDSLEFSVKGDILSLYAINMENPVRISFFDDEVEFIKTFDVQTQQIYESLDEINVFSVNFLTEETITFSKEKQKNRESEEKFNEVLEIVQNNLSQNIILPWAMPYSQNYCSSIFEFFNDNLVVFDNPKMIIDGLQTLEKEEKESFKEKLELGELSIKHKNFYFGILELFKFQNCSCGLVAFQNLNNANNIFKPYAVFNIPTTPQINYGFNKTTIYDDLARQVVLGNTVLVYAESKELAQKMADMFLPKRITTNIISSIIKVQKYCVNLLTKKSCLSGGFTDEKCIVIGLENNKIKHTKSKNLSSGLNAFLPEVGDYVVHNSYGVGKCVGITKLNVNNAKKDYIEIEYKNNDKLFLPVENIDSLSKYVGGEKPKLNKLGSNDFIKTKQKVKEGIKKLTFDLQKLYAERMQVKGIEFPCDDEIQEEFEKNCPFSLTADQEKAVNDVKVDMQSSKVMDRLICGDVGFGKTEVSLRAAFKAVLAGYQVMLLCPTTILSEQHFNTFNSRMKSFGVRVEVLNRFKSTTEAKKILQDLSDGEIDIIVGTHRLLSKDVKTKKLGLLILDEEQRFGVEHKEKIKKLKSNIDVLTLSATPIPRTLHTALIGVKDISVIETAPFGRVPVITVVSEQSDSLILNAIQRELNRDGQVLIVYNRVETIYDFASYIRSLVGEEVLIDVAHGQMDEKTLENSILKLYNRETQILISTTLIENGIDLPMANTLIVTNSDKLGLSQLYQLKGRIGRSTRQGYAIFCYSANQSLTEEAYKRLGAIMEYSGLGNGFKIAMRDLEIRGAGSLFGAEQSGHIESVGYSMYLTLLDETMKEMKGEKSKISNETKIDCYFDANLPNYYVENSSNRMEIYSEIAKVDSLEKEKDLVKKLEFNFGEIPTELKNLIMVARVKNLCSNLSIKRISIGFKETKLYFNGLEEKLMQAISKILDSFGKNVVLNLETLPILTIKNDVKLFITLDNLIKILKLLNENVQ